MVQLVTYIHKYINDLQLFIHYNQRMTSPHCVHITNSGPRVFSGVKSFNRPEMVENFHKAMQKDNLSVPN